MSHSRGLSGAGPATGPILAVRALDAFYGRAQVLFGVELALGRGEVVALMGRNGAGKSTTLKSIVRVGPSAPSRVEGELRFEGRDLRPLPPYRIARLGLGYVPEDRRVFAGLTVAENLEVGRRPARAGAPAWTRERLFALFPALAELQRRRAGTLSGGEQQMLSIARTLIGNPSALLLDEPSEGLAPVLAERLAASLGGLKGEGLSILLSEQNLAFATALADRAYVIERGRIRFAGGMAALAGSEELRAAYLAV
ncbi:MAG: ABC transporter ATP-binding protein [Proteobacteria bacterium]|nr:ABC transporter ATP-binding protein [Pseudomonadota bacterium]